MIQYREADRQISHYVVPRSGTEERESALLASSSQGLPVGALTVITWATHEIEQALVGRRTAGPSSRARQLRPVGVDQPPSSLCTTSLIGSIEEPNP